MAAADFSAGEQHVRFWPDRDSGSDPAAGYSLHLSLLGNLQCVVNLDAEVSNGALELGGAQEKLHRS